VILIAGCNNPSKTREDKGTTSSGQQAYVEVETFDAVKIKDQIVETIRKMPSEKEIATLLNEAGASYIFDLTVPPGQAEKLLTKTIKVLDWDFILSICFMPVFITGEMRPLK
jgi:hypothetical protein